MCEPLERSELSRRKSTLHDPRPKFALILYINVLVMPKPGAFDSTGVSPPVHSQPATVPRRAYGTALGAFLN